LQEPQYRVRSAPAGIGTAAPPRRGGREATRDASRRAVRADHAESRSIHGRRAVPGSVAKASLGSARPQPGHRERTHCDRASRADHLSPEPGDGQRADAAAGRRDTRASRLLRRLAQCLLRGARRQGRHREAVAPVMRSVMKICLEGKVALVTGAGAGIGLATAQAFAQTGAAVALAHVNEDAVRNAAEGLVAAGHNTLAIRCNVADKSEVAAMVAQT